MHRVAARVEEVTGHQRGEANKDAVAMGVGLVLFWPALFFLVGDDKADELGRLRGEYEALERSAIEKKCGFVEELQKERERMEEEEEHDWEPTPGTGADSKHI